MAKLISKTYGDALFDIAVEKGKTDVFFEEVKGLKQVLTENPELLKFLGHPDIELSEKISVVENVFHGRTADEVVGLLRIVVTKGRSSELMNILDYFIAKTKEFKKIGIASVVSAAELSDMQKSKIVEKLLSSTSYKEFEMSYGVDPSLIGGIVIRIGDRVVDGSVRNKIATLKKELSGIQLA
ncbi:MAG: ATP synthase F1 subunit delta [Lachnospiraceae bacterium]|nr:ATP synthase F1 subunit delta [Lachnospiraceae bacterium]